MIGCMCGGLIEGSVLLIGAAGALCFRCARVFLVELWKEMKR